MMNNLSKNLKLLRKRKGLSQTQLAEKANITRSRLAAYESKNVEPRMEILIFMANFFEVSLDDLIIADISTQKSEITVGGPKRSKSELEKRLKELETLLDSQKRMLQFKWKSSDPVNPDLQKALYELDNFAMISEQAILLCHMALER
ncbi:MAG: helix-turn-helix transcriptional regulator [Saprospiraceae bacterium]